MEQTVRLNSNSRIFNEHQNLFQKTAQGISDVLVLQGYKPLIISGGEEFARIIDTFEAQAFVRPRNQLNLNRYLGQLASRTDIASNAQADFLLTDLDMYSDGTNFVFGVTLADWQLSVQSIYRFTQSTGNRSSQERLTTHIARHEFAHMAGLNEPSDYTNPDRRGGLYKGHCANLCTMHQVISSTEVMGLAQRLNGQANAGFCKGCIATLRKKAIK